MSNFLFILIHEKIDLTQEALFGIGIFVIQKQTMKLNPNRLSALLERFRSAKHIPYTRIGEILGSKSDTVQGKGAFAKKALEHPSGITLSQVQALADFMERPVESLIFGDNNTITSIGDDNQNIIQSGSGNVLQTGGEGIKDIDTADVLKRLRTLSAEQREALLTLLK